MPEIKMGDIAAMALAVEGKTIAKVYWSPEDGNGDYTRDWVNFVFTDGTTLIVVECGQVGEIGYRMVNERDIDRSKEVYRKT